jgi:arsenate reductase (thioredoxin)
MKNLLFLCTGNSCRSQMAEAWAKKFHSDRFHIYSAGTQKHGMNPYAVAVMEEVGLDLTSHYSKTVDELPQMKMDIVVTVCSDAHENCPFFAGEKVIHIGFEDPPRLAKDLINEEEILQVYRRVRDLIKAEIIQLNNYLEEKND